MANIRLVERLALPLVDGSGVAVAERVELARVLVLADDELYALRLLALLGVEFDGDKRLAVLELDRGDRADAAIDETRAPGRPW